MPTSDEIAQICHEANRAYCVAIGDTSQHPWESTPDAIKQSAIDGVVKHIGNPDMGPEESHQNWLDYKAKEGWKYGAIKDLRKKEHPCFMPYEQLPHEQQVKDRLFKAIVDAVLCRT